jgi:hypothetical protein
MSPVPERCPSESELLLSVLAEGPGSAGGISAHAERCSRCQEEIARLRGIVRGVAASTHARATGSGNCLDDFALGEFLAGDDAAAERSARIAHLATCGRCRTELAALLELCADPGVTAELGELDRSGAPRSRRRMFAAVGLLAAAVCLAVVWPKGRLGDPFHRAPTITATAAPLPEFPRGDVAEVPALRWTSAAGADRYRVTLFEAKGRVRYQIQTSDTLLALPDSVTLVPERSYLWKVEARTEVERWTSSELVEFQVLRRRP